MQLILQLKWTNSFADILVGDTKAVLLIGYIPILSKGVLLLDKK